MKKLLSLLLAFTLIVPLATGASELSSSDWSETASSNNQSPPNGWPESMAPSTVNDAAREMMSALKKFWNRINPVQNSGGSSNAFTLTPTGALAAYVDGEIYSFQANFSITGSASLNISSLGAKTIKKYTGGAKVNLVTGDIVSGQPVQVVYDGTDMVLISRSDPSANPTFKATKGTSQVFAATSATKITFTTETFDIGSYYDSTNSKWTPPAGKVRISAGMTVSSTAVGSDSSIYIYKNGSPLRQLRGTPPGALWAPTITSVEDASGTDYFEIFIVNNLGTKTVATDAWFDGEMVSR